MLTDEVERWEEGRHVSSTARDMLIWLAWLAEGARSNIWTGRRVRVVLAVSEDERTRVAGRDIMVQDLVVDGNVDGTVLAVWEHREHGNGTLLLRHQCLQGPSRPVAGG